MEGQLKHLVDWKYWDDADVRNILNLARKVKTLA